MSKSLEHEGGLPYPTTTSSYVNPPYNPELQTGSPYNIEYQTGPPHNTGHPAGPTGFPQPPPPYSSPYPAAPVSAMNQGNHPATSVTYVTMPSPGPFVGYLGSESNTMVCPHCQATIKTKVEKHPSNMAYLSGFLIAIFGCFCGCCLIPCCMDSCKRSEHRCPNCNRFLGQYAKYF